MNGPEAFTQDAHEATPGAGESSSALGVDKFAASWQQLDNTVSAALYR
jgi:hypothetical protein